MSAPASQQLSLDMAETTVVPTDRVPMEIDLVDAVVVSHGGDYRKAISELLADADFLRDQLYAASCLISSGLARGSWKPKYERV